MDPKTGNWQVVKIEEPENAATELANFIKSSVTVPGEYNLLYTLKLQEIMIQIDARDPSSVKCYMNDLDGRAAPATVREGLDQAFSQPVFNKLIDLGSEKRKQKMFEANIEHRITPEKAIDEIEAYQKTQALKQAAQPEKTHGWLAHTLFGSKPKTIEQTVEKRSENTPKIPGK